jgi:hypothetical protein
MMDYDEMDVHEVLDRLHRQLILEGWSFDGATSYVDNLAHVQGQEARECAVLWALKEFDCLHLLEAERTTQHVIVTTFERVAVYA